MDEVIDAIRAPGPKVITFETTWESINKPGAYGRARQWRSLQDSERGLDSRRFPPAIVKESRGASVLLKLSDDPFIITFKARLLCAQHNMEANF